MSFLSPDSISHSFDSRANGYSRGEGFGMVVLKRLSDAIRDGNVIRAVIRGTSANQDGKSPGLTQPTSQAQIDLIHAAYRNASLTPDSTRYFEAHGTGTSLGDPIEATAISTVFTKHRSPEEPIIIGALKSNIGHLEATAGIAGLIKSVLVLERGIIPPNIWFEKVNPKIPIHEWHLKFPTKPQLWPAKGLRRASVNAFGFGGSNSHVILDDAFHYLASHGLSGKHRTVEYASLDSIPIPPEPVNGTDGVNGINGVSIVNGVNGYHLSNGHANGETTQNGYGPLNGNATTPALNGTLSQNIQRRRLFVFSTYDEAGAARMASSYVPFLESHAEAKDLFLEELAHTLTTGRTSFPWKFFVVADSVAKLTESLKKTPSPVRASTKPGLGFIFTGQGAQWHAMGRELLVHKVFAETLLAADLTLRGLGAQWSVLGELLHQQPVYYGSSNTVQASFFRRRKHPGSTIQSSVSLSARHSKSLSSIFFPRGLSTPAQWLDTHQVK
jgi:acyl transferase domain-containing protein